MNHHNRRITVIILNYKEIELIKKEVEIVENKEHSNSVKYDQIPNSPDKIHDINFLKTHFVLDSFCNVHFKLDTTINLS